MSGTMWWKQGSDLFLVLLIVLLSLVFNGEGVKVAGSGDGVLPDLRALILATSSPSSAPSTSDVSPPESSPPAMRGQAPSSDPGVSSPPALSSKAPVVSEVSSPPALSSQAPVVTASPPALSSQAPVVPASPPALSSQAPVVTASPPALSSEAPVVPAILPPTLATLFFPPSKPPSESSSSAPAPDTSSSGSEAVTPPPPALFSPPPSSSPPPAPAPIIGVTGSPPSPSSVVPPPPSLAPIINGTSGTPPVPSPSVSAPVPPIINGTSGSPPVPSPSVSAPVPPIINGTSGTPPVPSPSVSAPPPIINGTSGTPPVPSPSVSAPPPIIRNISAPLAAPPGSDSPPGTPLNGTSSSAPPPSSSPTSPSPLPQPSPSPLPELASPPPLVTSTSPAPEPSPDSSSPAPVPVPAPAPAVIISSPIASGAPAPDVSSPSPTRVTPGSPVSSPASTPLPTPVQPSPSPSPSASLGAPSPDNVSVPVAKPPRASDVSAPSASPVVFNISASPPHSPSPPEESPSVVFNDSARPSPPPKKSPGAGAPQDSANVPPPPGTPKPLAPSSLALSPVSSKSPEVPPSAKPPTSSTSGAAPAPPKNPTALPPPPGTPKPLVPSSVALSPVSSKSPEVPPSAKPPTSSTTGAANNRTPVAPQPAPDPPVTVISPSPTRTRLAQPPPMVFPSPPNAGCNKICTRPSVTTLPETPCSCVIPMRVGLRLEIPISAFLSLVSELAKDLASGTSLEQNQVQIVGASATGVDFECTEVKTNLVPLQNSFSNSTAFRIAQRLWLHQVPINTARFVNYTVLYVIYPGLPEFSQATIGNNILPPSYSISQQPLGVDIHTRSNHKLQPRLIAIIALSCIIAAIATLGVSWFVFCRRHRYKSHAQLMQANVLGSSTTKRSTTLLSSSSPESGLSLASSLVPHPGSVRSFTLSEMIRSTESFNPSRVIGEGGFGRVYSGALDDGTKIAVKVLIREDQQGDREFTAEVEMLSRLHHRNLVKLVGICTEDDMRCLVYELIPNKSVESHLHGEENGLSPLSWEDRLKIALGAARALAYLHEDSFPRVIHRDFKSSNILLEEDFTPKVSDFGLAKAASEELTGHISTRVMGTFGYVAPEYAMTGHLLVKSDVYSYGVVLLELLSGRRPVDMSRSPGQENLVTWARPLLTSSEGLEWLIDPSLKNTSSGISIGNIARVAAIAAMCVHPEVAQRPFMGEVVQALKLVWDEEFDGDEGEISPSPEVFSFPERRAPGAFFHYRSSSDIVSSASEDYERPLSGPISEALEPGASTRSAPATVKNKAFGKQVVAGSVSEHGRVDRYRESKLWR